MELTKWHPFREFERLFDSYGRLTGLPIRSGDQDNDFTVVDWAPAVDIDEKDGAYLIKAELPGVKKEDVNVTIDNGMLTLKGEKRTEKESEEGNGVKHQRCELFYGQFARSFRLPEEVNADEIDASYDNGILTLTIPKTEKARTKAIEVEIH